MPKPGSFGVTSLQRPSITPDTRLISTLLVMWNSDLSIRYIASPTSSNMSTWSSRSGCSGVPSIWLRTEMLNAAVFLTRLTMGSRLWRPIDHPGERSLNRCVSRVSENVLRHGTVRHGLEPSPVQGGKQHTGIAVAHVDLSSGQLRQATHDRFHHPAGTVTAAPEPHRVVALVISDVEEGPSARFVIASEMSVRSKALRVEDDLRRLVRV